MKIIRPIANPAPFVPTLLETARLTLRAPVAEDAAAYLAVFGDEANAASNPRGYCRDIADAQAALANYIANWQCVGFDIWAVCLKESPGQVVGFGGVGRRAFGDEKRLNLGYGLHRSIWGQGLAKELADAAIRHARDTLREQVLWARVQRSNAASCRILQGAGMHEMQGAPADAELLYAMRLQPLRLYDTVRVVSLRAGRGYGTGGDDKRLPQVGDVGAVLEAYTSPTPAYEVECCEPGSPETVWLGAMYPEELQLVETGG